MSTYPVLLFGGRDTQRRQLLIDLDPEEQYKAKSLIPFLGKPMIQWVIDILEESEFVDKIYILGLEESDAELKGNLEYIPVQTEGMIFSKYKAGLDYLRSKNIHSKKIIIAFADIPGLTLKGFNEFMENVKEREGYDFILSVVPADVIEKAIPNSSRAVADLGKIKLVQGDILMLSPRAIEDGEKVINSFSTVRKKRSFLKLLLYIARKPKAWTKILKVLLKRATLHDGIVGFERAFDCKADAILIDDPGLGMDMDVPGDYERLEEYVKKIKTIE